MAGNSEEGVAGGAPVEFNGRIAGTLAGSCTVAELEDILVEVHAWFVGKPNWQMNFHEVQEDLE